MDVSKDNGVTGARTAVVANPAAANGRVAKHLDRLSGALRTVLGDYELVQTERPGHATELTRALLKDGFARVVSVGGDGTHNEVLNGFLSGKQPVNPDAHMALLTYGTGGDLSRTLRQPRGPRALERLAHAEPMLVDVGCVTHGVNGGGEAVRYFINVADFGAGGQVVKRVNDTSKFFGGFLSFFYAVVSTLMTYKNPVVRLDIDDMTVEGPINNVIVANGQYYGGGMHVAPEARLDSGRFEVYVIGDIGRFEAIVNLPKLYRGHLLKRADKISYYLARRVVARSNAEVLLNLDGEQPGQLPAAFEILPKAVSLLV
ncbi:MAG: diacylglycerol kinase family lipid kinase [Candidatus Hydrogenedentes bacterium]|nr:diacylglycerol kinase family lipid kinase [Candidatus Hydrogenedentota bacterium]